MGGLKWCLLGALLIVVQVNSSKSIEDVEILFINFNKQLLDFNKRISSMAWESM